MTIHPAPPAASTHPGWVDRVREPIAGELHPDARMHERPALQRALERGGEVP